MAEKRLAAELEAERGARQLDHFIVYMAHWLISLPLG
jgi:hypothetical protein